MFRFIAAHRIALLLATVIVISGIVAPGTYAQGDSSSGEIDLKIGAPPGSYVWVTTPDGTNLGGCTVPDSGGVYAPHCTVTVNHPSQVVVHLDESTLAPGSAVSQNPVYFDTNSLHGRDSWGGAPLFVVTPAAAVQSTGSGTSDIAIVTQQRSVPVYDACYILVGYSNEGCDANGDGQITFEDIPVGTYTLRQTRDLGAGRSVPDQTIRVSGNADSDGWERIYVEVVGQPVNAASADIALITRAPQDGKLLTDVCYQLYKDGIAWSQVGCDENADGQTTFADVPAGEYVVRQTTVPAGYEAVVDHSIFVEPRGNATLGFVVKQASAQNAPGTRNVSVVFVDIADRDREPAAACAQIVGASNVGCDQDLIDGQIDFIDVPVGTYPLEITNHNGTGVVAAGKLSVTVGRHADGRAHEFVFIEVVVRTADHDAVSPAAIVTREGRHRLARTERVAAA